MDTLDTCFRYIGELKKEIKDFKKGSMDTKNIDNYQHIYLYMDDSGKISKSEDYAVFGGIVFTNDKERSEFVNKYRAIINEIKCNYCSFEKGSCPKKCPEIKGMNIKIGHRRRLMNLSAKYLTFGTAIINQNLNSDIINRVGSKGRFNEYAQRRVIKEVLLDLINNKTIDPCKSISMHINIDEMPTKTNGYYTLDEGLFEELKNGIVNFNYAKTFPPIVHDRLKIKVKYRVSSEDYCIQMADIIANTLRRALNINRNWYDTVKYLKTKFKINVLLRLPN